MSIRYGHSSEKKARKRYIYIFSIEAFFIRKRHLLETSRLNTVEKHCVAPMCAHFQKYNKTISVFNHE